MNGESGFGRIGPFILLLVLIVLGPVIGMLLLSELAPLYLNATADFVDSLNNGDVGTAIGNAILGILAIAIGLIAPVALFGIAVAVVVVAVKNKDLRLI